LLIVDELANEQILTTDNLPKFLPAYQDIKPILGASSIVTLEGEHWRQLRKMFNPAFATSHLETMIPLMVEESEIFITKLKNLADTGEVVRMNNLVTVWLKYYY
jgi:cytochrome P450